ncbi:MAG: CDP-diacylglycerol--serine O-phosphatidyltransferase [Bacteroidales bacterium]|nr:CDP-diacylglycerol--serine O-phosphatidyltransferase [Bacteroidales bacterium]
MANILTRNIPNTITCLNLLSGAIACIFSFRYAEMICGLRGFEWAFIFIGIAAVFDFADGAAARALKAYSELGKQLDSLSDLVSFGLAPALLVYNTWCYFAGGFTFWALCALYIAVAGALRLARFNIDTTQSTTFRGLPIPANAIFWVGYIAWVQSHAWTGNWVTAIIVFIMASLMLSRMRMFSLKFKNFEWRENFRRYVIILAAILFVISEGIAGLAWTILLYILISAVGRKGI